MKVVVKHEGRWLHFGNPLKVLRAERVDKVLPMLAEAEVSGCYVAGFISYEAAPAFDSVLEVCEAEGFPLLCLGLFPAPEVLDSIEEAPSSVFEVGALDPSVSKSEFVAAIGEIKERIAEGATYQVNYTYRLNGSFSGDPWAFFCALVKGQQTEYAAFVETDEFAVCSASPELFFSLSGEQIVARPMKGTAKRGRTFVEDWQHSQALCASEKDRAENIMIVDMIRNDIGRVATLGSVETVSQFDVEKYPTVWQMTSTVKGQINHEDTKNTKDVFTTEEIEGPRGKSSVNSSEAGGETCFSGIMKALFPCASITGAPKAKTMEIIRALETSPRKVYTGNIGFMTPQGEACFNVAIRTALIDRSGGTLEYGVGGGIVWDSDAESEYEETLMKAKVLTQPRPDFQLLETMLWEAESGFFLLNDHLQRLGKSAAYFDVPLEIFEIQHELERVEGALLGEAGEMLAFRIRLLLSRDGAFEVQTFPVEQGGACSPGALRMSRRDVPTVRLAETPVDSQDVFLFHKTTHRAVYEAAKADAPDCDDVILWNERGEVTESTIANVVIRRDGRWITPPVDCGVLAGTFREHLLQRGEIEEAIITVDELRAADEIYLINSVRRWRCATLVRS